MKDYLAMVSIEPQDKLDSGVKGMKWGVSRSSAQLKTAAATRQASKSPLSEKELGVHALMQKGVLDKNGSAARDFIADPKDGSLNEINPDGSKGKMAASKAELDAAGITNIPRGTTSSETSTQRYSRLQAQGKAGDAKNMSDVDLKFFNSRTEALAKIAKLNETKPGWLSSTAKKVLQSSAEKQLQSVADLIATKYIGAKIADSLKDTSAIKSGSKTPVDYVGKHRAKK